MKHHSNHATFLAALLFCINLQADNSSARIAWLSRNAIQINSIDPTIANDDFADLKPLKAAIGNSRIVVLGEQSHGDGATFLAKCRLVKFLHQRMGFDVLAWLGGRPYLDHLPAVMLSGSCLESDAAAARQLGARDYLVKPADMNQMAELARELYQRWLAPAMRSPDLVGK